MHRGDSQQAFFAQRCGIGEPIALVDAYSVSAAMVSSSDNSVSSEKDNGKAVSAQGLADRLNGALDMLERAIDARMERENQLMDTEAEVQRMGADRTRLAESLDEVQARAQRLESSNREVSRRLVDAMESIRAVLDREA